jgi:hypothetical protein
MSHAAPQAGIRKKTSPAPLVRDAAVPVRPTAAATSSRRGLPTVAVLSAALATSMLVTVGCHGNEGDDDGVSADHVRRPARRLEHDPEAPPTGSVVTIASTAPTTTPTTAPTPIPIALGGAVAPVMPTPPPVPTTKPLPIKPVPAPIGTPTPHAMPGGAKAVVPTT